MILLQRYWLRSFEYTQIRLMKQRICHENYPNKQDILLSWITLNKLLRLSNEKIYNINQDIILTNIPLNGLD